MARSCATGGDGAGAAVRSGLAEWIEAQGAFPNSMVDCIVPATGPAELALAREFGIDDAAPVTTRISANG
jgi:mannitol-1-phosphate/altronate dehydrogenase